MNHGFIETFGRIPAMADIDATGAPPARPRKIYIRRHSIVTRLTHWLNVLCLSLLLMSGMQIFNAHPSLYWGQYGGDGDHSWLEISATDGDTQPYGTFRIGNLTIATTGVLGASKEDGQWAERGFPAWA